MRMSLLCSISTHNDVLGSWYVAQDLDLARFVRVACAIWFTLFILFESPQLRHAASLSMGRKGSESGNSDWNSQSNSLSFMHDLR